ATENMNLVHPALRTVTDVQKYTAEVAQRVASLGLKGAEGTYLVHLYGRQADEILKLAEAQGNPDPEINLALSELTFSIRHEMVVHADDFLVRRTGLLYFNIHRVEKVLLAVLESLATSLKWSDERRNAERERIHDLIHQATAFRNPSV
ncbi:MAG: hypothetical protein JNK10_14755, partial [Cyclobacteriaceae bacterium]|nr:hypothetical protein [Cyclobacteriaceae bacterium]